MPSTERPDLHILVYTRDSCPLCDKAIAFLKQLQAHYRFTLEVCDIGSSEELTRQHGNSIPVVIINGRLRFRGHVNAVLFRRLLDAGH